MICTVTTAKDTLANLQRFVRGNLAGGVDHLVVVLEQAEPATLAWLRAQPAVSVVDGGTDWWRMERPESLNHRQIINANLVAAALHACGWASWLFHVDADELLRIDRPRLEALSDDVEAVQVEVREAVSQRHVEDPDVLWFKRRLPEADLVLLHSLGVIDKPANTRYFKGHLQKAGARMRRPLWLGIHDVLDDRTQPIPGTAVPGLELLHLDSVSGEEFVAKWANMVASGKRPRFRRFRAATALAMEALIGKGLPPAVVERYCARVYEATRQDDLATLRALGVVERLPLVPVRPPVTEPTEEQRRALDQALAEVPGRWSTLTELRRAYLQGSVAC